jgi:hypothetical protein
MTSEIWGGDDPRSLPWRPIIIRWALYFVPLLYIHRYKRLKFDTSIQESDPAYGRGACRGVTITLPIRQGIQSVHSHELRRNWVLILTNEDAEFEAELF